MAKEYVKQAVSSDGTRTISAQRGFSWQRFLFQWEWMLVLMLILVNIFNISASPYYAHAKSILNATRDFLDKAIVVFPMAFVLMLGEIDISVASIMALSATIMGVAFDAGVPMIGAIGLALVTGTVCGLINGIILVKFPELSSMIVTLATSVLAANEDVTLVKVKDNVCTIKLGEDGEVIKQLISVDNEKKEVTLQIDVKNLKSKEEETKPTEMFLVVDDSKSMSDNTLTSGKTRKEAVFTAAKTLAEQILKEQPSTKIGVVSFSSNSEISKEGTLEDAKLIIEPSNKIDEITSAIDNIQTTGGRTNIDAGLQTAKAHFSTETTLNKYLILLTDGVPNNSVGTSLTYSGNTAKNTKATLKSIQDSGINIITVMTGVNSTYQPDPDGTSSAEAAGKTYKDLAEEIFGTQESPTYGKFYYVLDESVENTITKDVYQDVSVVIENEIKDITVVDYFPLNIVENYDFEIFEEANIGTVTPTVDTKNNSITWKITTLKAGETASFKYKLKLKEKFNEKIINVETPTNQKVDVEYTGTDGTNKKATSDVTPSIMLKKDVTPEPKPEEPKDNSIAPNPIPQTGDNLAFVVLGMLVLAVGLVIYIKKR